MTRHCFDQPTPWAADWKHGQGFGIMKYHVICTDILAWTALINMILHVNGPFLSSIQSFENKSERDQIKTFARA